ncbi:beta-ketoacyl synthase N-terminal-like domain-containing protein [Streptomyces sp. NRRL F-5650]|uniref:beta-ketoacyl synthase N-terminal-like domain-containing protein n=1 Tax=Streptomyces sp. NRRL F-5650 TaxID=1463868 RepID=UPI0004CA4605|nr:beta-ketoacyl synthase N-terminal-like domain-containing protein [Streptomyces sp. NRRL F-5650]
MLTARFDLSLRNPFVAGHLVRGQALLPGLAYVDLILQAFARHGHPHTGLELRTLSLYHPLTVGPGQVVPLALEAEEDTHRAGTWRVRLVSGDVEHVTAQVHRTGAVSFPRVLDLAAERAAATDVLDLADVYRHCRDQHLVHEGSMRCRGTVHRGPAGTLVELEVADEARADAPHLLAHPALLDAAAVAAGYGASLGTSGQPLHLPLCYESFRATEALTERCTARIPADSVHRAGDLLTLTIEFYAPDGRQVAELRGFTSKPQPPAAAPVPPPATPLVDGRDDGGWEPVLRAELARELRRAPEDVDAALGFYEMGLDSAALLRVVNALQRRADATLPPSLLFEYTTVPALSAWLTAHHPSTAHRPAPAPVAAPGPVQTPPPAPAPGPVPGPAQTPASVSVPAASSTPAPTGIPAGDEECVLAVVGMSGRYPGAPDLDAYWNNLRSGVDSVTRVPRDRWDPAEHRRGKPGEPGHISCEYGGFLDDVDKFDPLFFNIAPRDAVAIDPLERLFLEQSWLALEDAGYTRAGLRGPVGVYAGAMFQEYPLFAAEGTTDDGRRVGLGTGGASIANRVSYLFGFTGPSMLVDTACSSSLTAVHIAARALRGGEIRAALVGGVNLSLHPNKYLVLSQSEFLSEGGRCAAFGADADGMVPGEGVGVLVLKRLADAERDGDHIHGLVRGTAVNHGGRTGGYTVPDPRAQHDVITAALADAGADPSTVSYVEAHGTGTPLGDPVEVTGLARALGRAREGVPECAVGSVKSGIGHLEAAAGVAGLTKVLLQLRHGELAPTLHADRINPGLELEGTRLRVNTALRPWTRPLVDGVEQPLRAGVSSFGAGGANAHVVVEEYRDRRPRTEAAVGPALVVLSARDEDRLRASAERLRAVLGRPAVAEPGADQVRESIARLAADVSGAPAPAPDADLAAAGFDTVATARLLMRINRTFGVSLAPTAGQEHPTLDALAAHLRSAHGVAAPATAPAAPVAAPVPALHEIAHTLLVGREAQRERLALVVPDTARLAEELDAFLAGRATPAAHRDSTDSRRARDLRRTVGDAGEELVRAAVGRGDLAEIADLWAGGVAVDAALLYPHPPVRVPLPGYPFARERHWITDVLKPGRPAPTGVVPTGVVPATPAPAVAPVPSVLAEVEEAVAVRPRVYEVESSLPDLSAYQETVAALSGICRTALLSTFRDMGALRTAGERVTRAELRARLNVADRHHRLFDALLELLGEAGFVRVDGDTVTVAAVDEHDLQAEIDALPARRRDLLDRAPDNEALLTVLDACLSAYPEVLSGRKNPLDVLFPGGSFAQMDAIYKNQQQTNALMAQAVREYVTRRLARDPGARITLLEIGAGTGGTSRGVLAALEPYAAHLKYHYTDLGSSFVQYGAQEYGGRSFVEFRQLDIERDPLEQGFEAASVDVVVAGNVLHATRDIGRTLRHAKALMKPHGMLALFEVTRLHELLTISFGLLEGWWTFEDTDRLPGSPLLSVPMWRRALERAGLRGMRVLSGMPLREDRLSESVLLSESDGLPVMDDPAPGPARPAPASDPAPAPASGPAPAPAPVPASAPAPAPVPASDPVPAPESEAAPEPEHAAEPTAAPDFANDIERLIAEAWQEVLGVDHVRDTDNFQDLGGDSIMASRIKARLNSSLPFELEMRELMTAATVREMAELAETEIIERIDELPEDTVRSMFAG